MEDEFTYQLQAEAAAAGGGGGGGEGEGEGVATYTDPNDGTVYEWDNEKRAWFPKLNSELLASYHAGYNYHQPEEEKEEERKGEVTTATAASETPTESKTEGTSEESDAKKRKPSEPSWFDIDEAHNTNVYVSGLPLDITEEEFIEHMSKCGIIMEDEEGDFKVKLYHDSDGQLKGDGLCCYLKVESVQLAIDMLDESQIRGNTMSVKRAQFQLKGAYNPSLRKKKHSKKKNKGNKQERLLDWRERKTETDGGPKLKHQKIIIFKHLFDPKEFEEDPTLITDIRDDLREECSKFGDIKKVLVFDRHIEGVASVAFKEFESAEACIGVMNGRYYGGKQLEVFPWDGTTNYQIEETEKEREQRLQQWEQFLVTGKGEDGKKEKEEEQDNNSLHHAPKDTDSTLSDSQNKSSV